jgi:hypothetical protein
MDPARDNGKSEQPVFAKRMEDAPIMGKEGSRGTNYLKWGGLACIGLIALILIIILGGRAMTGYSTYSAMTANGVPEQYATDMTALASAKSAAEAQAAAAQAAASKAQQERDTELAKIAQERESHAATKAALQSDLERSQEISNALQTELDTKESAFEDSSNRLCCIQRVLDPKITGYAITTEGTVACVIDGSGTDISC